MDPRNAITLHSFHRFVRPIAAIIIIDWSQAQVLQVSTAVNLWLWSTFPTKLSVKMAPNFALALHIPSYKKWRRQLLIVIGEFFPDVPIGSYQPVPRDFARLGYNAWRFTLHEINLKHFTGAFIFHRRFSWSARMQSACISASLVKIFGPIVCLAVFLLFAKALFVILEKGLSASNLDRITENVTIKKVDRKLL